MSEPVNHISELPLARFNEALRSPGVRYRIGPFQLEVSSPLPALGKLIHTLYGDFALVPDAPICDFHLRVQPPRSLRRWLKPQVEFISDESAPFAPLPLDSAFPLMEWGFNWCVATSAHQYLMLHAAVVERDGCAVLMPAFPGSGKSTLTAALVNRGWRLLSDEFGLVRPGETRYVPFPRCIPLKNESIAVIGAFAPEATLGPVFRKTRKGDVAHMKPPSASAQRATETADAAFVIFPRFEPGTRAELLPISRARACIKLCTNSFNYEIMGEAGFSTVADLIDASECRLLHYGDLDAAIELFDALIS